MDSLLILGIAAAGVAVLSGKKSAKSLAGGRRSGAVQKVSPQATLMNPSAAMQAIELSQDEWPEMTFDIPFAAGDPFPTWPTVTNHSKKFVISYKSVSGDSIGNWARKFMVSRGSGRYHVGVDLYAYPGDPILAMESGTIVNIYHFYHGTYALVVQCDSGLVINYGEIANGSWREFGLQKGSRVIKGRAIARVGQMSGGSHMLHFETYMPPTSRNKKYHGGDSGPILNPAYYLLRSRFLAQGAGRAFAGADCVARASLNREIPQELQPIAKEDRRVNEKPGDSVLPELLTENEWRPLKDNADGP